jgi:pimeloyl-ACP methyl ester carboxylesterase
LLDVMPSELTPLVISFPKAADGDYETLEARTVPLLPQDEPFAILGESFSGPLALRIAARARRNLVAVILVASFTARPVGWLPRFARHFVQPLMFRLPIQLLLLRWFALGRDPPPEVAKSTIESVRSVEPAVLAQRAKAALSIDASHSFIACPVPILYLGGTQDRLIDPRTPERLKALRPDLECVMLDAPHFILQIAPSSAARAISEFLHRQRAPTLPALPVDLARCGKQR